MFNKTSRFIFALTCFCKHSILRLIKAGHSIISFMKDMPSLLRHIAILISIAAFSSAYALTLITLAPDQKDFDRNKNINKQYYSLEYSMTP